jgi:putative sigma-54 modulation protein
MTARKGKISKALRDQAEEGLERMAQILGRTAHASVTFSNERHIHIVELAVQGRLHRIAATGKADTQLAALREAIERAEHQAHRYRDRRLVNKRLPKGDKLPIAPPVARSKARAEPDAEATKSGRSAGKTRASIKVHSFPAQDTVVEPHILNSADAIALKPMSIEEAVKETEFRDRDLLIFRTVSGDTFVLHRRRDGQMELVEIP